jgi:hypothetical protein
MDIGGTPVILVNKFRVTRDSKFQKAAACEKAGAVKPK